MGDPIEKAVEKLTPDGTELAKGFGRFLERMMGSVPHDLVGYFGGDAIRHWRLRNVARLERETERYFRATSNDEMPRPIPPKAMIPALDAASLEDSDTLMDMWARLLASAADPASDFDLTPAHVRCLAEISEREALLLRHLYTETFRSNDPRFAYSYAKLSSDEDREKLAQITLLPLNRIMVAMSNLERLGLIKMAPNTNPKGMDLDPTDFGIDLFSALRIPSRK